jgi:hypothetical protein
LPEAVRLLGLPAHVIEVAHRVGGGAAEPSIRLGATEDALAVAGTSSRLVLGGAGGPGPAGSLESSCMEVCRRRLGRESPRRGRAEPARAGRPTRLLLAPSRCRARGGRLPRIEKEAGRRLPTRSAVRRGGPCEPAGVPVDLVRQAESWRRGCEASNEGRRRRAPRSLRWPTTCAAGPTPATAGLCRALRPLLARQALEAGVQHLGAAGRGPADTGCRPSSCCLRTYLLGRRDLAARTSHVVRPSRACHHHSTSWRPPRRSSRDGSRGGGAGRKGGADSARS